MVQILIMTCMLSMAGWLIGCQETSTKKSQEKLNKSQSLQAGAESASESQNYFRRYSFTENNCTTGNHEFHSEKKFCYTLLDEEVNQSCARGKREYLFQQDCSGPGQETTLVTAKRPAAAFCRVQAQDLSAGISSKKTSINQEFIDWDRSTQFGLKLMGGKVKDYGLIYLNLVPAYSHESERAHLVFNNTESDTVTMLRGSSQDELFLQVGYLQQQKVVTTECELGFVTPTRKSTSGGITCEYYYGKSTESIKQFVNIPISPLDTHHKYEKEVSVATEKTFKLTLERKNSDYFVEIQAPSPLISQAILAKAKFSQELTLFHSEQSTGDILNVRCHVAQK
ncbi:MAG: hypothetical protein ACLGGX_00125 [Bdellovibrionia bacterium]